MKLLWDEPEHTFVNSLVRLSHLNGRCIIITKPYSFYHHIMHSLLARTISVSAISLRIDILAEPPGEKGPVVKKT